MASTSHTAIPNLAIEGEKRDDWQTSLAALFWTRRRRARLLDGWP